MKKHHCSLLTKTIAIAICICIIAAGCSTARKPATPAPNTANKGNAITPRSSMTPVTPTTPAAPSKLATRTAPPAELEGMRATGRDIVNDLIAKNYAGAAKRLPTLDKYWATYKPKAAGANATTVQVATLTNDIAALKKEITAKKWYEGALAANKITLDAISFMKLYQSKIPYEVNQLGYYGRQVLLTVQHNDWAKAKTECNSAAAMWGSIKNQSAAVSAAHSKTFADTLTRLGAAIDKKDKTLTVRYAKQIITQTDTLKKDFSK